MGGLKNRFPPAVREFWIGWFTDMIDGRNDADCLHHIISPSSQNYVSGSHNKSILNSCPLNNNRTHLYNPELHKSYKEKELLQKILELLVKLDYKFKPIDEEFYSIYRNNYKKIPLQ